MGDRLRRFDLSRITGREDQRPPASLTLWQVDAPLRFKLLKLNPSNLRRRGNNLIPNGGFARGVNGWNGNTGTETVTVDRGAAGTAGGNSMVVRTSGRLFSGVFFSQKLNVLPRAAYVFSFRVRGKPGQTVLPTLEWYSASKSPSSIVQTSGVPLTGSWQLVTVDYTAPRRSTRVVPAIVLKGTAKTIIRIDAVRLARGSSATPGICPR
jgi:hypothetical protein